MHDDEIKKHSSPEVQFKEFSLAKQKLDLERTMSELGKPVPENVKTPHVNKKPLARNQNLVQTKN